MRLRSVPALFNWAGSKARVARALCELKIPRVGKYHEPFLGSGAAYFGFISAEIISTSQLSDTNPHLVNIFRAVQTEHDAVIADLRMHALLDSDVHFSAALGRLNSHSLGEVPNTQAAADAIYLLSQSYHSTWYETLSGHVSMSRRSDGGTFRARHQDVVQAAALLKDAIVSVSDFRTALSKVGPGDLVFLDPPYLYGSEASDKQGYNSDRFTTEHVRLLAAEMKRLVALGAHVIFCWGERNTHLVPDNGLWIEVGRDHVWLSGVLARSARHSPAVACIAGVRSQKATRVLQGASFSGRERT